MRCRVKWYHMALKGPGSPFERLRQKYEDAEPHCVECGFVDEEGGWRVRATGSRVRYQHTCRICGASNVRELRL